MIKELCTDTALLSTTCQKATAEDAAIAQDLLDTMDSMDDDCACLAANQIGSTKAVIAYEAAEDNKRYVMYNPKVKQAMRPFKTSEACYSVEKETNLTRFAVIKVAYQELVDGELVPRTQQFQGWTAQIIQHSIDHCKGRLV